VPSATFPDRERGGLSGMSRRETVVMILAAVIGLAIVRSGLL
jgi:hypothetical protein